MHPNRFTPFSEWPYTITEAASTVVSTSYAKTNIVHTYTIYNNAEL